MSVWSEIYHFYKDAGICVNCHARDAVRGQTRCPDCRDRHNQYRRQRTEQEQEQMRKYQRERYESLKGSGLCVRCGKRPPESGKSSCTFCLRKQSQYRKNERFRNGGVPRQTAIEIGWCPICCKRPVAKHRRVCEICYDGILRGVQRRETKRTAPEAVT